MHYTIYKITNKINNKIYIGKHQTENLDDGYMGSGKHLKRAIEKYGIENFTKEILYILDSEEKMNAKEAELVNEDFVKENTNYNLCPGGQGGFGYINNHHNKKKWAVRGANVRLTNLYEEYGVTNISQLPSHKNKMNAHFEKNGNKGLEIVRKKYPNGTFDGKKHNQQTKRLISIKAKERLKDPTKNSQYGTVYITNGTKNKKIKKFDVIPEGWYKGYTSPPKLNNIQMCNLCIKKAEMDYWIPLFRKSNMSYRKFIEEYKFPWKHPKLIKMNKDYDKEYSA